MKSAILLVVEDDIRCSRYVDICFSWRGGSRPAHFKITAEAPERIGLDRRYRKFGEMGAKKVFSYNAMKRFLVRGHFRPPDPLESLNRPISRAFRSRQITNLALRKPLCPYN